VTPAVLWLGLLFGLRHALEPDHVAAIAALATRSQSTTQTVRIAGFWGLGHASTILLLTLLLSACGVTAPRAAAPWLEAAAGMLLIYLGIDVLRRLRSLRDATAPAPPRTAPRAFAVGAVHGMAGSAALTIAVVPLLPSRTAIGVYLILFGLGSALGMVLCSLVVALPLRAGARRLSQTAFGSQLVVGITSVALGCWLALRAGA
jgi:cytochrome c biogenesis protein CcdA